MFPSYSRPSSENYQVQQESSNSVPFNSISNIADQLTQISKGFKEEQYYGQQPNYVQQKPRLRIQAPVKRSIYFNVPQGMQNNMPEQIMKPMPLKMGLRFRKTQTNDVFAKQKQIDEQIASLNELRDHIIKNGMVDLSPWAIDTLNKAGNAKMALDTIKKAVKSNAESKPAEDPKSKVETFIANGNWNSAEKPIKGDDLNSYFKTEPKPTSK